MNDINTNKDVINHPDHYQSANGLEVIDVIKEFTSGLEGIEATDTGNILKYICRWKKKNGVEDLKKAKWYLEHLIDYVESTETTETITFDMEKNLKTLYDLFQQLNNETVNGFKDEIERDKHNNYDFNEIWFY